MEVASQHAEAIGKSSRMGVEEWLLFDGIALQSGGVSPGGVERAAPVKADLAYTGLAFRDGTAMTAGKAANAAVV